MSFAAYRSFHTLDLTSINYIDAAIDRQDKFYFVNFLNYGRPIYLEIFKI